MAGSIKSQENNNKEHMGELADYTHSSPVPFRLPAIIMEGSKHIPEVFTKAQRGGVFIASIFHSAHKESQSSLRTTCQDHALTT